MHYVSDELDEILKHTNFCFKFPERVYGLCSRNYNFESETTSEKPQVCHPVLVYPIELL
jgi:hypothetical protein